NQLVARRRREAAELDRRAVAAERADPHRLLVGKDAGEAIEIRQSRAIVIGAAYPRDRLAHLEFLKAKRAGPHDVVLEPVGILVEQLLLVDEGERIGER